ncbi:hypothetical protein [Kineosporia babensis]|uniref:Uncharacterized protein n=1 Tax=Kineosporia babensis TaxID=499548 RepID=A0A9X1NCW6_9ACTN|nr:hypothetical protein [Kineosporia babensis]MCD5310941.1 hypothetical protein [Kineosporia babensis]
MDSFFADMVRSGEGEIHRDLAETFAAERSQAIDVAAQSMLDKHYPTKDGGAQ